MRKFSLLVFLSCLGVFVKGQPVQWNAAQIKAHLEKLDVLGSVLYIAAHPDDENTRLLAYLSNGKQYQTAYLSCTRGDGGQNLVGNEQGSELGLIRTQELLAARRIDGATQFFTTANDFGFSKSAKETLKFWDHDRILGDVVWAIRKFQPDILICRFPEDRRAGHGHHWTSAILAHEAFKAAADPKQYPQQLKFVKPWQAKRLLWNTFNFGQHNTTAPDQFHVEIGDYNPLLGKSYGEIAAESRSMHKSQGFGSAPSRTQSFEYFTTIAGDAPKQSLLDGVNTDWARIKGGNAIGPMVQAAITQFKMDQPEKSVPALLRIYQALQALPAGHWKDQKLTETKQLIVSCLGLFADATIKSAVCVPGETVPVHIRIVNRSDIDIKLRRVNLGQRNEDLNQTLKKGIESTVEQSLIISDTASITQPYWLLESHPTGYYNVPDPVLVGMPMNPPPYQVGLDIDVSGVTLPLLLPVLYKHTEDVEGELYQPLVVAPPVVVNLTQKIYLLSKEQAEKSILVQVEGFRDEISGKLHLDVPPQFEVIENDIPFKLAKKGDEWNARFKVHLKEGFDSSAGFDAQVTAIVDGKSYTRGIEVIQHSHIPTITLFPKAVVRLVAMDLKTNGKEIGYVEGAGDLIPEALTALGYHVTIIKSAAVSQEVLSHFDAIITGIRAYNINELLKPLQPKLLEYVKNGGVLLVQYNKNGRLVTNQPGPYPFDITSDRVTEEDAKVKFLLPDNPAMQYPNKIANSDFDGWIQERGLYFTQNADSHYQRLFEMHDVDSSPLDGSTLICNYGKGKYVYSCLDFFRELPAGIPGAFRLFVNLISKPE